MRRLISITGAIALAAAVAAPAAATPAQNDDGDHKVLVCHATSSAANPYVAIVVDIASAGGLNKLMGHLEHQEDSKGNGFKKQGPDYIFPFYTTEGDISQCPGGDDSV